MRVVITGASGDIGRVTVAELAAGHDLVLLDRRRVSGMDITLADLSLHPLSDPLRPRAWLQRWPRAFEGADVVVHLAANRSPRARWWRVLRDNVKATWNVLEVAAACQVPKVVFASSNWSVIGLRRALGEASWEPDGPKIGSDAPPRPLTAYGVSKGFGEIAGRTFVDEDKLVSFVSIRIGHCPPSGRAQTSNPHCRHHWIGLRDMRALIRRCVEKDLPGYHVVHAVSAQPESPLDLARTRELLDWEPEEWAEPLERGASA